MSKNTPYLEDPLGNEHLLENEVTILGRAMESGVVILSNRASREHAQIRREGRKVFLEDMESTNGTFLNNERIQGSAQLRDGDQVLVGDVTFTFRDPDTTTRESPFPELEVNAPAGEVRLNRRLLTLSPKEFALAAYLYDNRGKVCSKDDIGRAVWAEYQSGVFEYQIENLVRRLRTKIEIDPNAPLLLVTIRGLGYKLTAP
ncbi:MAG: winged helix-turn-helix domain-containing protein [Anaerolineae bacterium]|jgi:pSer/pThr/pTyr-binding forkhead associated (FHA) protein|nr:winged helix-turn-helix domain-containing protein [Anaerolineae bacterium]